MSSAAQAQGVPLSATLTPRQKWLLLGSLMVSLFVGALDQTVVTTATPRILAELGGFALLAWLFTSYMLASTVVIPLVGKLGDIFGRKQLTIAGVVIFMLSSAACGAATSMPMLIAFRAVQGIGGGMIFASVFATLGDIFPPAERGKYVGLFTGTFSLASILGPPLGGLLTDNGGWRWVFYINVPIALIAIPAIWRNLPSRKVVSRPKIDFNGAIFLSIASVSLLLALEWGGGGQYGWTSVQIVGLVAATLFFTAAFIWQEARHPEPTLPLHLFKNRTFLLANLTVFTFGAGVFGAFQYLGLFLQTALNRSATASGVISTPQSLGVLAASIIGGQLISRTGHYRWQTSFGAGLIFVAILMLTTVHIGMAVWHISVIMVVLGIGFGLVLPTMSLIVQNAVSYQYLGVASSSSQFFRQIGSVVGIAVFGAILANTYNSQFESRLSVEDRELLGPAIVEQLEDPTLKLNRVAFARIEETVRALPDGEAVLLRAESAQNESVATATRHIFIAAAFAAVLSLLFTLAMRELPLRKTMDFARPPDLAKAVEPAPAPSPGGGSQ